MYSNPEMYYIEIQFHEIFIARERYVLVYGLPIEIVNIYHHTSHLKFNMVNLLCTTHSHLNIS